MMKVLGQNKFRNLLFGRVFAVFGDSLVYITLLKWVELHSGSTGATTWYFIAFYLPAALFAIPIGAWIEGKALQRIMIVSDLIRGGMLLLFIMIIPFVAYQWAYVFLFTDGILSLFFIPANQSLLPYVVEKKDRPAANGMLQASFMLMRMAGHGVAALLIAIGANIQPLLFSSAALVILSLLLIKRIKPIIKTGVEEKQSQWRLMFNGLSYVWKHRLIRGVFSLFMVEWLVGSSIELIFVAYITNVLGMGVENISFFTITQFIGMMAGAAIAPQLYSRFDRKWFFVFPVFAFAAALFSLNVIGGLTFVLPFYLIAGFSFGIFSMVLPTFIQDTIDERYFSRTFSLYTMIFNFMPLPGLLIFGLIISQFGIKVSIVAVSVLLVMVGLVAILLLPKLGAGGKKEKTQKEAG